MGLKTIKQTNKNPRQNETKNTGALWQEVKTDSISDTTQHDITLWWQISLMVDQSELRLNDPTERKYKDMNF